MAGKMSFEGTPPQKDPIAVFRMRYADLLYGDTGSEALHLPSQVDRPVVKTGLTLSTKYVIYSWFHSMA
ncbi:hypothetical protein MT325_m125R [Paramecium bursaria chlorella virus MT325]|uniref:Uncharacterized protein m125R n=2 Tax=Paramecium bursaria Chlorella virus A1 TaxID=381899 RepID=A7ITK5_PBCVM|nr:hypothetical protein FR483_n120R [Paramecium bursaria Chlorella virus FR483]ABT13679.1 hypothetical protein MT325_m125R [Paramecium bursaria chlorella virus MT325]ABT15405.1 hypothetical protein FR483_n120R [Paramecium bursaria Chlorella virus FR483]